jgi:hypothetical protein
MAEKQATKKVTLQSARSKRGKASNGFTAEEKAAMRSAPKR